MSIVKYTPFAEFDTFPAGLRVFQDTVNRLFSEPNGRPWVPAVDIQETENELIVKADIPDVDMKDIDVRMENGTLTLRGERKFGQEKNEGGWHRLERRGWIKAHWGASEKADYKNGVLTITLPKKEVAKPRQIKVSVNG